MSTITFLRTRTQKVLVLEYKYEYDYSISGWDIIKTNFFSYLIFTIDLLIDIFY